MLQACSTCFFHFFSIACPSRGNAKESGDFEFFLAHLGFVGIYFVHRLVTRKKTSKEARIHHDSAWWYSNGSFVTADQLVWRWKMLRSQDHYAVVNVTCADKAALDHAVQTIITGNTLLPFFQQPVCN